MKRFFFVSLLFIVPFFIIDSPKFLTITGIRPCWTILWLLPFSLQSGSKFGVLAGLLLGLISDSLIIEGATYIPSLMFLGFWWGSLAKYHHKIKSGCNLGLLALLGNLILGASLWVQKIFFHSISHFYWFNNWALHTLMAETLMTALIAPLLCSWLLIGWKTINYKTI